VNTQIQHRKVHRVLTLSWIDIHATALWLLPERRLPANSWFQSMVLSATTHSPMEGVVLAKATSTSETPTRKTPQSVIKSMCKLLAEVAKRIKSDTNHNIL
jgi:hypothetical protein